MPKTTPRGKLEIRADVLRAICSGPGGKEIITKIARKARLKGFEERLDFEITDLIERGFVQAGSNGRSPQRIGREHPVYSLTERGNMWLQSYDLLVNEAFGCRECDTMLQPQELGQK